LLPTQQPAQVVLQVPQAPLMHESPGAHATQALPPVPQVPAEGATHWPLPEQQPFAQDALVQRHCPFTHSWPGAQGACPPHEQEPPIQLSAVSGSQAPHAAPDGPHEPVDHWRQTPLLQQPPGQVVASHTHWPFEQR
jgi:hypothetical protein